MNKKFLSRDIYDKTPRCKHFFRIMKVTTLFLFVLIFCLHAENSNSQNVMITLKKNNAELESVLNDIEKQTDYLFVYNKYVNVERKVSVDLNKRPLEEALNQLFKGTNVKYLVDGAYIVLSAQNIVIEADKSLTPIIQQGRIISGVVKDSSGEPVIGANIVIKGSKSLGTVTDVNGRFSINVENGRMLTVSYIGYNTKDVQIGNTKSIDILLVEDTQTLDEVVVVGYGSQRKATLTGAVSAISNEEIITTKNESVKNMLTGKVPGVRVVQKSSQPGEFNTSFDIRGFGNPLVVIDGIPRDNMDRLDANDIESLSVLKDASAAIYGVRAANGVVLITTKKGKKGSLQLEYTGNMTWQNPSGSPKSADAIGWMTLKNEKANHNVNGDALLPFNKDDFEAYRTGTKLSTDWWDVCMRDFAPQTQHTLSATGGSDKVQFYLSAGYMYQESFIETNSLNYERYNVRSNVSAKLSNYLTFDLNMNGILDQQNRPLDDPQWIIRNFQRCPAIQPVYANGNPNYLQYGLIEGENPVAQLSRDISGYNDRNKKWFQSSMSLTYDVPFVKGLQAKGLLSYDLQIEDNSVYEKAYNQYEYDAASDQYITKERKAKTTFRREYYSKWATLYQFALNYNRKFNSMHNISGMLLLEGQKRKGDNFFAKRELSIFLDQLFAGNSTNQEANMQTGSGALYEKTNLGLIGKFGYDYVSKYLAEFSFRYDGSSMFGTGSQWGFFPSASLGWRISEENFWKESSLDFINNVKIRASYGKMGDDGAANYQFISGYNYPSGGVVFDGDFINAAQSKGIPNRNITWYIAKTLNLGVDAEAWNGLLGASFDYFVRERSGLLAKRNLSLPDVVGADLPQENLNGDRTRGLEVELSHRNRIGDFNYNIKGLFSFTQTRNTYEERGRAGNSYKNWRDNGNDRIRDIQWGWSGYGQFVSYDQIANNNFYIGHNALPGDYIYEDWNGDGQINDLDKHPIGYNGSPLVNFSLSLGAQYKGFDLNMLLQGASMFYVKYVEQLREPMWGNSNSNALAYFLDRWHLEDMYANPYDHDAVWIPGKYPNTGTLPDENSVYNFHNASYLRLKSIELGYTLPTWITMKAGINSARVFVNGYNLLTFKKVELDPEHPNDQNGNAYPLNRTFSIGLNVKF